jgi:hypothetical protein
MSNSRLLDSNKQKGFTLVEMLVIAPVVLLTIGAFITVIVNMTGDVLASRGSIVLAYDVQDALNRIEDDIKLSTTFLATNNISLTEPQGYDDNTANFDNVDTAKGDMLILNTLATTDNPLSSIGGLVYLNSQPNDCATNAAQVNQNTPMTMNVVYYVKTVGSVSSLWRRTIAPSNYSTDGATTVGCDIVPWQQPSCTPGQVNAFCKTQDNKLIDGISPSDFTVQYYTSASSTEADSIASNTASSSEERNATMQSDTTVNVSINISKLAAGRDINQSGSIRATRLDINASTIAVVVPPTTAPVAPSVTTAFSSPTTATFDWARVPTADTYTLEYNINGGSWTVGLSNTTLTTFSINPPHGAVVSVRVTATNSAGTSTYGTATLSIPEWAPLIMQNSWIDYSTAYNTASYRKTSEGVVVLRGLVKRTGTPAAYDIIGILPEGYRPTGILIFQNGSNSAVGRVDVYPDGRVLFIYGSASWFSLDDISFIPEGSGHTRVDATPLLSNGWTFYGGSFAPPSYVVDGYGRVHLQGLGRPGTTTNGTQIINLPQNLLPPQYMHISARSLSFSYIGLEYRVGTVPTGIVAKGGSVTSDYLSVPIMYYPAGVGSWTNLTLQNGWVWYTGIYSTPQYTKAPDGLVSLKGLIKSGTTTNGTVLASLPAGYRPARRHILTSVSNGAWARIDITATGAVNIQYGGSSVWISLDGLHFYADQ